jgi:hypothetical protein
MKKPKIRFEEYNTARKGQHFMGVSVYQSDGWVHIGRIYREYDPEAKKYNYQATDSYGNRVFEDYKGLFDLKQQFIEHGERLAQSKPKRIQNVKMQEKMVIQLKTERGNELKNIRNKKTTKEIPKENARNKTNEKLKEKELDDKNPVKYKEGEQGKETEKENSNEAVKDQESIAPESDDQSQDGKENDESSERMDELNELRETDDLEEDIER